MNEFEGQVLTDLSVLKSQMDSLIGNGQPGRLCVLEARVEKHELGMQRVRGFVLASGVLLTVVEFALKYFRLK